MARMPSDGLIHSPGYCVMKGACGKDGINCLDNSPADEVRSKSFQELLSKVCRYPKEKKVCCTEEQISQLQQSSKRVWSMIGGCGACWNSFLDLWCDYACSPNQSQFVEILDQTNRSLLPSISHTAFYVSPVSAQSFYDACKNVKFGPDNSFAMSFLGNNAKNYSEMLQYMGMARPGLGSPYQIDFPFDEGKTFIQNDIPEGMQRWEAQQLRNCSGSHDLKDACSCVDCENSCPILGPMPDLFDSVWSQYRGQMCGELPCLTVFVIIIYGIAVVAALSIGIIKRGSTRRPSRVEITSSYEPLYPDSEFESFPDEPSLRNPQFSSFDRSRNRTGTTSSFLSQINDSYISVISTLVHENIFFSDSLYRQSNINEYLQTLFYKIGFYSASNPKKVLSSVVIAACFFFFLSISSIKVETRPEKLWVAPESDAAKAKQTFDENFGPFYRAQQLIISRNKSAIRKDIVRQAVMIREKLNDISIPIAGNVSIQLNDICVKPLGDNCMVQSIAAYWEDSLQKFDRDAKDEASFQRAFSRCTRDPTLCLPTYMQPLKPEFILGGYDAEKFEESTAIIMTIILDNSLDPNQLKVLEKWEDALVEFFKELKDDPKFNWPEDVKISFMTENSIENELQRESGGDISTILISYLVMFVYSSIALGKYSSWRRLFVDSKFSIGFAGIMFVAISIIFSVGIFSIFGLKITLIIAEVIPFLVLAIGVDNLFIIVQTFDRVTSEQLTEFGLIYSPEERVGISLARMGPSIFLSALSETLAFSLGSFVSMPAVKSFAAVASLAIWIDFCLQITAFAALLALDTHRSESNRIEFMPCIQIENAGGKSYRASWLQMLFKKFYAPILLHPVVKIIIALIFSGSFMLGLSNLHKLEMGFDQRVALPRDSYLIDYFDDFESSFNVGPPLYFMVTGVDVSSYNGQSILCSRFSNCSTWSITNILEQERKRSSKSYIAQPTASWIDDYFMWLNPLADKCCRFKNALHSHLQVTFSPQLCGPDEWEDECHTCIPQDDPIKYNNSLSGLPKNEEFLEFIQFFLQSAPHIDCPLGGAAAYSNALVISEDSVKASHFRTYHTVLKSQKDFIEAYSSALKISQEIMNKHPGKLEVAPYSVFHIYFDQYLHLFEDATLILSLALLAIFICSSVLLGSIRNALLIIITVIMILVDLVGIVMYYWEISLNAVSLVNIVICVGISVEFCTHISRAFSVTSPHHNMFYMDQDSDEVPRYITGSRERRVFVALVEIGSSVFAGITLTKFLGISVLAFAQSKIFEIYYFRMYLSMVLLGFGFGLMWLPVILSWFGAKEVISTSDPSLAADIRRRIDLSEIDDTEEDYQLLSSDIK